MLSPYHAEQRTPPPSLSSSSNIEFPTQQTQLTEIMTQNEETSNSPIIVESVAKLLPSCGGGPPIPLVQTTTIGRSPKCDICVVNNNNKVLTERELARRNWAFGLISNRHCRIEHHHTTPNTTTTGSSSYYTLTDTSGNGTCIMNQANKILTKGTTMTLQSGDEICLLNPDICKKKIRGKELQEILQQYSYVFVLPQQQRSCVVNVRQLAPSLPFVFKKDDPGTGGVTIMIGEYKLLPDILGTGTTGEVRRAIHCGTGQHVAVKVMARGQLEAEAEILQALDHPYIIRLLNVYQDEVSVYLVMELMETDLFERVSETVKYTEPEARYVMRRLLSALHYLHEHANIVHRDLKPENILVRGNSIKITDFGLAKQHGRLKTFCGTPQYFAPEVMRRAHTILGKGRYGKPADLYSVGVILHVMLTGCTPQLEQDAVVWDPHEDAAVSKSAKGLVQDLLHPNPTVRTTVMQACEHPWMLVKDGDTHEHPLADPLLPEFQRELVVSIETTKTPVAPPFPADESPSDGLTLMQLCTIKKQAKSPPRRPLSPLNGVVKSPRTSLMKHKSITPGSSIAKDLSDDDDVLQCKRGTTTTNDDSKPRRVSEMQPGKRVIHCTPRGTKKKKNAMGSGQKSLKSFFSPST